MIRNREHLLFALGAMFMALCGVAVCALFGIVPALVCGAACTGITAFFYLMTARRYKNIAALSDYLRRLSNGKQALDIRDNKEGELSILKNEIYKVTAALTEQADTLAKDKAELANALADISHQLKTPLTALGLMTDLLDDDLPPERRRDFLNNIRSGQRRMEWLVLNLLKLARLDADQASMKRERHVLKALADKALEPLLIAAELKELDVAADCDDTAVLCDPEWTAEALGNVIKNAVENCPAGGRLEITSGRNPLYAYVRVYNSGAGIESGELPRLFQRFYRGKNTGGAGIGLAISLAVMRKQNGDIEAQSDNGAVFTLKFYAQDLH